MGQEGAGVLFANLSTVVWRNEGENKRLSKGYRESKYVVEMGEERNCFRINKTTNFI
jgi:hypothetical protein